MRAPFQSVWRLLRETVRDWSDDGAPRLAAALSYYTLFSLAPLLVIVIAVSALLHTFVEKPVGKLRRRFGAVKT